MSEPLHFRILYRVLCPLDRGLGMSDPSHNQSSCVVHGRHDRVHGEVLSLGVLLHVRGVAFPSPRDGIHDLRPFCDVCPPHVA